MISIKQLCHKYEINSATLNSALIRLGIAKTWSEAQHFASIRESYVPLLDNYFNYRG